MPILHVHLLGDFRLLYDDAPVTGINTVRLQSLLAYLVLHRDAPQSRQHLAFLLWPDSTEAQALTNLRNLLHKLRQALPDPERFLHADTQTVQWRPDAPCTFDVADFISLAQSATRVDLEQAVNLYRGDLLPSCYDDWIAPERERLQQVAVRAFERLIGWLEEEHEYKAAIGYGQRLRQLDPLNETIYRTLMRLHAADNDRAGALRVYHTCVTTLQDELAAEPAPETRELYQRLLSAAAASPIPVGAAQNQPPLVGRQREWKALQDAWYAASSGKPHCVILTGEAGIGKTRLADELLVWTSRQGFVTAVARCYAAEGALAYAPIIAWLRSPALRQRLLALEPVWATEAARLLPELLAERPDLPYPAPLTEGAQRQRLFEALARVMLKKREPLLLLMDDLLWCDRDSLEWLRYLLRFDPAARLLVVGTVRAEDLTADHPLVALLSALRRDGQLTELVLGPLTAEETASLAAHLVERTLTPEQAARLFQETEGNPLFVVETMRSGLETRGQGSAMGDRRASRPTPLTNLPPLPPKVHAVLGSRLAQLSPNARELAGLAATIGREFTFPVLARASDQDDEALVRSLDELWQRRIVRDAPGRGTEAYDFTHDKLREVAYNSLSAARRRLLHRRIAQALEAEYSQTLDVVSAQLASHLELAGRLEQAIPYYQRAAESARRVYANADAIRYYRRALALLEGPAPYSQALAMSLYERLGDLLHLIGQHDEAGAAYRRALVCLPSSDLLGQARLQRNIGKTCVSQHQFAAASQAYDLAQAALGPEQPLSESAWWQEWFQVQYDQMMLYYWQSQPDRIEALVEQTRSFVEQHGTPAQRARFFHGLTLMELNRQRYRTTEQVLDYMRAYLAAQEEVGDLGELAFATFVQGFCWLWHDDLDKADAHLQAALTQAEHMGDIALQARCLTFLTIVQRRRGALEQVRNLSAGALLVATTANMPEYIAQAKANGSWVAWRQGDLAAAKEQAEEALAIWRSVAGHASARLQWPALWPLIDIALRQDHLAEAAMHVRALLDPAQVYLPDILTIPLEQALQAWDRGEPESARTHFHQAVTLAQQVHYL